jgi:ParB family chromosome partitioning protein
MPSTQNAVNNREYRSVPITALAESPTNPRKRFDAKSLEELAASFKTQGILAPLLVRELEESKYEVVAGARRLRAAKLAELEKLPVRVVKLTDAEAIEAQCVENLQREDIHPLAGCGKSRLGKKARKTNRAQLPQERKKGRG